jgi:hypothetical protein
VEWGIEEIHCTRLVRPNNIENKCELIWDNMKTRSKVKSQKTNLDNEEEEMEIMEGTIDTENGGKRRKEPIYRSRTTKKVLGK